MLSWDVNRNEFVRYSGSIWVKKIAVNVKASSNEDAKVLMDQNSEQKSPIELRFVIGLSSVVIQGDGYQIRLPKFVTRIIAKIMNVLKMQLDRA